MTVGTGIGGGIIIGGKLYRGSLGIAGEFGHTMLNLDCGGKEWVEFEKIASCAAIKNRLGVDTKEFSLSPNKISARAQKAFDEMIYYLSAGLSNIITILNPDLIVVGGGLSNLGRKLTGPLQSAIRRRAFSLNAKHIRIKTAEMKDKSGVYGACEIALEGDKILL